MSQQELVDLENRDPNNINDHLAVSLSLSLFLLTLSLSLSLPKYRFYPKHSGSHATSNISLGIDHLISIGPRRDG